MISTLVTAAVLMTAPPKEAQMKIVGASMFKNGFVVVLREMEVPASGAYIVDKIPQSSLGTLWLSTSEGTKLTEVVNTLSEGKEYTSTIGSLDGILSANVGKVLDVEISQPKDERKVVSGKLLVSTSELLMLESAEGMYTVRRADVISIRSKEKLIYQVQSKSMVRGLRFVTETSKPGKVYMVSLEKGATWVPAFALDITDPKKMVLTAKATVVNDLEDMDDADFRFITGFPNIRFAGITDPLVMTENADQFIGTISGGGFGGGGRPGAGGPGGRAGEMMNQKASAPMTPEMMADSMNMDGEGMQAGDLFFYTKPKLTLKRGERGLYMLFQADVAYKEIYTWIVEDETVDNVEYRFPSGDPGEVWHSVRFKNTSGQPLTTCAATTFKSGQILGQDMLTYTPNGAEAEVRITKALDVRVEKLEEEVGREPGAIKEKYKTVINGKVVEQERVLWDRLKVKGTLVIRNSKPEKVTMKVAKNLTGLVSAASNDAKIVKLVKGIRDINPTSLITWQVDVDPGKTMNLTYEFSMLVKPQG